MQRVEIKRQRAALQVVNHDVHKALHQRSQFVGGGGAMVHSQHVSHLFEDAVKAEIVTGKEDLLFVFEVVVKAALGHQQSVADVLHARAVVALAAKGRGGGAQDSFALKFGLF